MTACPCSATRTYDLCCAPIILGTPAPTPEALVRSRYSAFVKKTLDHVEATHAPEVREDFNRAEAERLLDDCEWLGLQIHNVKETDDTANVDYVVKFRRDNKVVTRGSSSWFRRNDGQWLFVRSKPASHLTSQRGPKVGRNDPCPCDSGKKYKKCCISSAENL